MFPKGLAAIICGFCLLAAPASKGATTHGVSIDTPSRLLLAAERLSVATGGSGVRQLKGSLDLAFLFDELEGLVARIGTLEGSAAATACDGATPSLQLLDRPECLAALLHSERREWRLATEIGAQAFILARQQVLASLRAPDFPDEAEAADEHAEQLEQWWQHYGLTGLDAIARIGREQIQYRETEDSGQHTLRIVRALRQALRETAVLYLGDALQGSTDDGLKELADDFRILRDEKQKPEDRLRAAEIVAAKYDARLAVEMYGVVKALGAEDCVGRLVPVDLRRSLKPTAAECEGALRRLKELAADAELEPARLTQTLTGDFDERAVTLRLLLSKLERTKGAKPCGAAIAAMEANAIPASGGLGAERLNNLANRLVSVVSLCRADIDAAFEETATRWMRALCIGANGGGTTRSPASGEDVPPQFREAWSDGYGAMSSEDRDTMCGIPHTNMFAPPPDDAASEALSVGVTQELGKLQKVAVGILEGRDISEIRPALDAVRVPEWTDGTVRHVEILRALCTLSPSDASAGDETRVVSALFRDVGLDGETILGPVHGSLCKLLARSEEIATVEALLEAVDSLQFENEDTAENARSTVRQIFSVALDRIERQGRSIARRVSAAGRVLAFARDAERVWPLGPEGFGCGNNYKGQGFGVGLKVGALDALLKLPKSGTWTAEFTGKATLVVCGSNGKKGLRRVFSLAELSADLAFALTLDEEGLRSTGSAVPSAWSVGLKEAMDDALRGIPKQGDALREAFAKRLPSLLQAAGVDLGPALMLQTAVRGQSEGLDVRYEADTGMHIAMNVPTPAETNTDQAGAVRFCVRVPLSESQSTAGSGCPLATEAKAIAHGLARDLLSPLLGKLVGRVGQTLNLEESRTAELAAGLLRPATDDPSGDHAFLRDILGVEMDGKGVQGLRLRMPAEDILSAFEKAGLPTADSADYEPLTGELGFSLLPDSSGRLTLGEVSVPSLDPRYMLARILREVEGDTRFLSVSLVTDDRGDEERAKEHCGEDPALRLGLGRDAPLVGTLGIVCLTVSGERGFQARLVPDEEGSLSTRNGNWVFSYRTAEQGGSVNDGSITLKMKVTSNDPNFERFSGKWATVRFNLGTGAWELPPDDKHNRRIYRGIERAVSDRLARGVRIYNLRIGSTGVEFSTDPSEAVGEAAERIWHTVGGGDARELVKSVAKTGCDLQKIYWLATLIGKGEVPERMQLDVCKSSPKLEDKAEPIRGMPVGWECEAEGEGPGQKVRECSIEFPKDLTFCGGPVELLVEWNGDRPSLQAEQLRDCLKDRIGKRLPRQLARTVDIDNPEFELVGDCLNDPQGCGIAVDIPIDLSPLFAKIDTAARELADLAGNASKVCSFDDDKEMSLRGLMTFDGSVSLEAGAGGLLDSARSDLRDCARVLTKLAARTAIEKVAKRNKEVTADQILGRAATVAKDTLEGVRSVLDVGANGQATCHLRIREGDDIACKGLESEHLQDNAVTGIRFTRTDEIAGLALAVRMDTGWKIPRIEEIIDLQDVTDGKEAKDVIEGALTKAFKDWSSGLEPKVTLGCRDVAADADCLDSLAKEIERVAGPATGGMVSYREGASLRQKGNRFTLDVPLQVKVPVLEREARVSLTCTVDATSWRKPTIEGCGSVVDLESFVVTSLAAELQEQLQGKPLDLGLLSYTVKDVKEGGPSGDKLRIEGKASLAALKISGLEELPLSIVFNSEWQPGIESDLEAFTNSLTGRLKDAVNDVIGNAIPLKIEDIDVAEKSKLGLPTAFGIESTADIAGLFSISAPKLILSATGFRIDGPNRMAISFPEGMTIPASPLAICPTGGGIEDTTVTVTANITLGECTASHLLKYQGQLELDIANPTRLETEGSLTLLGFIPLGSNEGVLDISKPTMSQSAEIGGAAKDVVEMQGKFVVSGDPMFARSEAKVALFRVPVGDGQFKLDLTTGELNLSVVADLGFAKGHGYAGTQRRFSRPRAEIDTEMTIGGFPILGGDIEARPRRAKVAITVIGLRFGLAFPGLDAVSQSEIAKALKRFLNLGPEDLKKALDGILSGNFVLNPYSDFGSGQVGVGGDGDGEAGESGAKGEESAEAAGDGEPEPVGDPPESGPELPAAGEIDGGPVNQAVTALWFEARGTEKLVHIGVGVKGAPDARLVAIAHHDDHHFDTGGKRLGVTMTVHDYGYSQILTARIAGGEGCARGLADVVYLYAGKDVPRRGYYELCRIAGPSGQLTARGLRDLDPDARADLAALNAALLAEFNERPLLPEEARVLMNGRLLVSGDKDLRGGVAFQRPGELLVTMRGKLAKTSECGSTAVADASTGWSDPRIFWITGLDEKDRANDELILDTVRALWGCPTGALARIDSGRKLLTTGTIISHGEAGFAKIAELEPSVPHEDVVPPWVGNVSKELKEAIEKAQQANERIKARDALDKAMARRSGGAASLCIGKGCSREPVNIDVERVDGVCVVEVNDEPSARYLPKEYNGTACDLSPDHAWLTISRGAYLTAITHGLATEPSTGLRIGVFGRETALSGVTDVLPDMAREGLTIDEYRLIRGFLKRAGNEKWPGTRVRTTQFVSHAAGSLALVAKEPEAGSKFYWQVHNKGRTHDFEQTGAELTAEQKSALLPLLSETPQLVDTEENGTGLWLHFERQLRMYSWNGDAASWTLLLELDRPDGPKRDSYEAAARKDIVPRLVRKNAPYHATVFPHARGNSVWGYALWSSAAGIATLAMVRASRDEDDWAQPRSRAIREVGKPLLIEGGNDVDWFDIRLPPGTGGMLLARDQEGGADWDQVLCLFTPGGEPAGCDDDSGKNVAGGDELAALLALPSSDEERSFVGAVRNFEKDTNTGPARIVLLGRPQSRANRGPDTCEKRVRESKCLALRRTQVLPDLGDLQHFNVPGIGLARNRIAFIRSLALAIDAEPESPASYSVFAGGGMVHAARKVDESELRLMSMTDGGTLSPVAVFEADQRQSHLPPEHAWPRLVDRFGPRSPGDVRLRGSDLELRPDLGREAWSVVLPAEDKEQTRTVFFKTKNGSHEVRIAGAADSPDVIAAAVSHLLKEEADKIEVRREDPIVAIVYPEPCLSHDPFCPQSLVRLAPGTGEYSAMAAFDSRAAPHSALEAALDLFVYESNEDGDGPVELNADPPFEGLWQKPPAFSLFRFSRLRPFRVVAEEGWAGCLSSEGLHWFELKMEDVLDAWPEILRSREVESCTKESSRHWTLTAGPRSVRGAAGGSPRRTILLHSRDTDGKLRILAVPRRNTTEPPETRTTGNPMDSAVAAEVVRELSKRLGPDDEIRAMTDEPPAVPGSGVPMIVFEIGDASNPAQAGSGHRTRLVAFYRPGDREEAGVCTLSGIEIVRPETTEAEFSETHRLIVDTLRDWFSKGQQKACEMVRPREFLLIEPEAGEWQVWERMMGSRPVEASGREGQRRSAVPAARVIRVAQANTHATDAASPESSNDLADNYVEVRQLGKREEALRIRIDDLLYKTGVAAAALEREVILAVLRVSASKQVRPKRPTVPNFRLDCVNDNDSCLLMEGAWGLQEVLGIDLRPEGEPGPARTVLLRGPTAWREAGNGLASRLAKRSTGENHAQIFDLRSSPAPHVHLAVRGKEAGAKTRPVFHWRAPEAAWRELGNLVPFPIPENAETKQLELPAEQAILDRLASEATPFRLISLPDGGAGGHGRDAVLLSFENRPLDKLARTETFFQDGSRGPDILTDKRPAAPVDHKLLGRVQAVLSSGSFPREHPVWLPGEEAGGLVISGSVSGFASGHIEPVSVQGIDAKAGMASPQLAFGENCRLPRDVARNLLAGHRHLGARATIACTIADGGVLLSDGPNSARQLVGNAEFRGKLMGTERLSETAALELAKAVHSATGHEYPELATGKGSGKHYAAYATSDGDRIWRERDGQIRELGVFSQVDMSDAGHLALLNELEALPRDGPFTGTFSRHIEYVALTVGGWNEVIVHGRDGATIRVELIENTKLGDKPVDHAIGELLKADEPRSFLASSGSAAVAFTRTDSGLLSNAFAYFDNAGGWFRTWPGNLESRRAQAVAQFLLELFQDNRRVDHLHRRADLLVACRSSARDPSEQSEFVLFDLNEGAGAGRIEWDDHRCGDVGKTDDTLLGPIHALAMHPDRKPGDRLLGYSTRNNTIGVLRGDSSASAQRLLMIEAGHVKKMCEAVLDWDHPARDGLTDWLARNGPCNWLSQSGSRIVADAQAGAVLLEPERSWDLEPFLDSDRTSLEQHARLLMDWFDGDTSLRMAACSAIRIGNVDVLPDSPAVFSASAPCFGLALVRDGVLKTVFRRAGSANQRHLSRDGIAWLARRFDGAIAAGNSYLMEVGDGLELTHPSPAANKAMLFVWNISSGTECSAVLPANRQAGGRIAVVRDLLRDQGPGSNWQGESYVRATWSELKGHKMAVLSRSETDDCVSHFLTPPEHTSLNASRFKHFARAISRPDDGWTVVELGQNPAKILSLLEDGKHAAFFSLFQQIGGEVDKRSVSIRSENDIRYAISRDQTLYHRLFHDSLACKMILSDNVEELLSRRKRQNGRLVVHEAWTKLFEAVGAREYMPRWYEPVLSGDPLHALDKASQPC